MCGPGRPGLRASPAPVRKCGRGLRFASGLGSGSVSIVSASVARGDGVGPASIVSVSAARCDGVGTERAARLRLRGASGAGFAGTGWASAQAVHGGSRAARVEQTSVGSARSRARGVLGPRTSVRGAATTWPVSNIVGERPSGRASSGRRVTDGCEQSPGNWRRRTMKLHEVGAVARLARAVWSRWHSRPGDWLLW